MCAMDGHWPLTWHAGCATSAVWLCCHSGGATTVAIVTVVVVVVVAIASVSLGCHVVVVAVVVRVVRDL